MQNDSSSNINTADNKVVEKTPNSNNTEHFGQSSSKISNLFYIVDSLNAADFRDKYNMINKKDCAKGTEEYLINTLQAYKKTLDSMLFPPQQASWENIRRGVLNDINKKITDLENPLPEKIVTIPLEELRRMLKQERKINIDAEHLAQEYTQVNASYNRVKKIVVLKQLQNSFYEKICAKLPPENAEQNSKVLPYKLSTHNCTKNPYFKSEEFCAIENIIP